MSVLNVGDKMPHFEFDTQHTTGLTTEKVLENGRTVFWVLRYIGCTTCRYDVHQIMLNYDKFTQRGTQVCVVMQSDPEIVRADTAETPLPFHIICDQKQEIYQTLNIRATETREERQPKTPEDIAKWEAKRELVKASGFVHGKYEGNEQQLPAMFIVEGDGTVVYAHYAQNAIDMPTLNEVLDILDSLPAAK